MGENGHGTIPAITPLPTVNQKLSARELRRRLNQESAYLGSQIAPAVNQLLHNDGVTQGKITDIERWIAAWQTLTFRQRLRWLLKGPTA